MLAELCKKDRLWREYAFKICGDKNTANDLVQEMYLRRYDNDRGQQMTDFYIVATLRSIYLNQKATNRLICVEELKPIESQNETFEPDDKEQNLLEKVEQLPFKKRELLELNYYYSLREIEKKYNINYGYVYRNIQDARKKVLGENINQYQNKRLKHRIMKSKGLGDTVEKITKATGIKKVVKMIAGEDCGCEKRKEILNKYFPYNYKPECLKPEQITRYKNFICTRKINLIGNGKATGTLSNDEIEFITDLFANVFNRKKWIAPCRTCMGTAKMLISMIYKLEKVYEISIETIEPKKQKSKNVVS